MTHRPTVLVTRPRGGAERFVEAFRARFGADWPAVISPLTEIVRTGAEWPVADVYVFTSEHAVIEPGLGRAAYCVGARTAEAARAAGYAALTGPGEARGLVSMILDAAPGGRIVHPRGAEAAREIAADLRRGGLYAAEVVVYRQETLPLSGAARALLAQAGPVLAPVFSPRGAARLSAAVRLSAGARLWGAAISAAAGGYCAGFERLEIASTPDTVGVLAAMSHLLVDQAG